MIFLIIMWIFCLSYPQIKNFNKILIVKSSIWNIRKLNPKEEMNRLKTATRNRWVSSKNVAEYLACLVEPIPGIQGQTLSRYRTNSQKCVVCKKLPYNKGTRVLKENNNNAVLT